MLRTWQDVIAKWQLATGDGDHIDYNLPPGGGKSANHVGGADALAGGQFAAAARSALLAGRLDEAIAGFEQAAGLRAHPHDQVGMGDVLLARGRWRTAARHYRAAVELDPDNVLAVLGMSQAMVAGNEAETAARDLERRFGTSTDPVLRYYLASTWASAGDQARARTDDEVLVITSEYQLRLCDHAARRVLQLDVDDHELRRGAERLLAEVRAGRKWQWRPEGIAVSLAVLAVSLGLILVAVGGITGSVVLVVLGIVLGSALLFLIVVRFRRQAWESRARVLAGRITRRGA
ncbi:tetratricopeptide repeat protein [Actinokineospora auranticolor]|uniref:Tetratricopeptide repeat protein n=1 Tax=Actinokineospora auranticolor TaxID=155976 RepID=A0A2S6GHS0_9PSEU|nr:tetratricopeptide repeat protein [Actinokineospora auranticolor]PPK64782.1 tetratricopeptide repeat protein [Actinokineospora auranticolor]